MTKVMFWCDGCGNEVTEFDAVVEWDYKTQTYEQVAFGDRAWCDTCFTDHTYSEGTKEQWEEALRKMDEVQ